MPQARWLPCSLACVPHSLVVPGPSVCQAHCVMWCDPSNQLPHQRKRDKNTWLRVNMRIKLNEMVCVKEYRHVTRCDKLPQRTASGLSCVTLGALQEKCLRGTGRHQGRCCGPLLRCASHTVDHRMRGSHLLLMSFCQSVYEHNFKSSPRDPKTRILLPH